MKQILSLLFILICFVCAAFGQSETLTNSDDFLGKFGGKSGAAMN